MHPYQTILSKLLLAAESHPGEKVTARLTNSLKVDCLVRAGKTNLQISRSSSWPTLQDWAMLQAHWPHPFSTSPRRARQYGRYYLFASIPQTTPPRLPGLESLIRRVEALESRLSSRP